MQKGQIWRKLQRLRVQSLKRVSVRIGAQELTSSRQQRRTFAGSQGRLLVLHPLVDEEYHLAHRPKPIEPRVTDHELQKQAVVRNASVNLFVSHPFNMQQRTVDAQQIFTRHSQLPANGFCGRCSIVCAGELMFRHSSDGGGYEARAVDASGS